MSTYCCYTTGSGQLAQKLLMAGVIAVLSPFILVWEAEIFCKFLDFFCFGDLELLCPVNGNIKCIMFYFLYRSILVNGAQEFWGNNMDSLLNCMCMLGLLFADGQCFIISSAEASCKPCAWGYSAKDISWRLQDSGLHLNCQLQLKFYNDAWESRTR